MADTVAGIFRLGSDGVAIGLEFAGRGTIVCGITDVFPAHLPILARGRSDREARWNAMNACAQMTNSMFCKERDLQCETDGLNDGDLRVRFDIRRESSSIDIGFSDGKVAFQCFSEAWNTRYLASAPTQIEALALARLTCAHDQMIREKADTLKGFFCKAEARDCVQVSGVRGQISIDDGVNKLKDIFKKKNR
jgi:hypothetical protein